MAADPTAVADFNAALDLAHADPDAPQPKCVGRWAEFSDYATTPDEAAAAALCAPCPLIELCLRSARVEKPEHGVRGGVAWKSGKQHHWLVRFGLVSEDSADLEK